MGQREDAVNQMRSWVGLKESDNSYTKILDIYNSQKPLPRNVKMKPGMAWCATTVSAVAVKLGLTDIMPTECSCGNLIEKAKKMGIWVENDAFVPQPGDLILYDWDDSGKGDDTGWPDHVGMVETTDRVSGTMTIIEGNYQDSVKRRTIKINNKNIRGFITPKYKESVKPAAGSTDAKKDDIKTVVAKGQPEKKDASIEGTYVTTANLNMRTEANANSTILCTIPKGTKVKCKGKYTGKWYYITVTIGNTKYKGFSSKNYLQKVN